MFKVRVFPACLLTLVLLLCSFSAAQAQKLSVNIVNGTKSSIPIVVVPFANQGSAAPPSTDVSEVVTMDLARSGKFRTLDKNDIVESPSSGDQIKFPTWKLLKQDYIVVGHVQPASGGAYTIGFELWNVNNQQKLLGLSYTAQSGDLRGVGHEIADKIFEKITGIRGAFNTRIAYITAVGKGKHITYSLIVADSDGYNPQVVVRSKETLLSPAWSPDGSKLAYVSFESGDSAVYIQDLSTGARKLVSAHKGINSAPAFSPDGNKLVMSLSYVGNPEIFVKNLATGNETRLTHNFSIDTEPTFMPDGKSIVFTSDRSGKPQLYEMPAAGGTPQRLTFDGNYNAAASVGPEGKKIAMVRGNGNVYRIAVVDKSLGGQTHFVSPGDFDDSPSFAPNGTMLMYAASQGLRGVLYSVSEDGKVRQRLVLSNGDVRQPAWGPYRTRQ